MTNGESRALANARSDAKRLLKALRIGTPAQQHTAAQRFQCLPFFTTKRAEDVLSAATTLRHRDALWVLALEAGFARWEDYRQSLLEPPSASVTSDLDPRPSVGDPAVLLGTIPWTVEEYSQVRGRLSFMPIFNQPEPRRREALMMRYHVINNFLSCHHAELNADSLITETSIGVNIAVALLDVLCTSRYARIEQHSTAGILPRFDYGRVVSDAYLRASGWTGETGPLVSMPDDDLFAAMFDRGEQPLAEAPLQRQNRLTTTTWVFRVDNDECVSPMSRAEAQRAWLGEREGQRKRKGTATKRAEPIRMVGVCLLLAGGVPVFVTRARLVKRSADPYHASSEQWKEHSAIFDGEQPRAVAATSATWIAVADAILARAAKKGPVNDAPLRRAQLAHVLSKSGGLFPFEIAAGMNDASTAAHDRVMVESAGFGDDPNAHWDIARGMLLAPYLPLFVGALRNAPRTPEPSLAGVIRVFVSGARILQSIDALRQKGSP